jgi:hypothetical protein
MTKEDLVDLLRKILNTDADLDFLPGMLSSFKINGPDMRPCFFFFLFRFHRPISFFLFPLPTLRGREAS